MIDSRAILTCFFAFLAFGLGYWIPSILVQVEVRGDTLERTENVITVAAVFGVVAAFSIVGNKLPKLKAWATNSLVGSVVMLFSAGLATGAICNAFILIPIEDWLLLSLSIALALMASFSLLYVLLRDRV